MADVTSPFGFPYPEDTDLVRDGASDIENLATGVNDYLAGAFLYAGSVYFTSSGSFVKADPLGTGDIGLRAVRVRLVGGGGGTNDVTALAADRNPLAGGGGGAGGYAEALILAASLASTETVTVGSGGANGTSGANGGATSLGTLCAANGGSGAPAFTNSVGSQVGAVGGSNVGTVGDLLLFGSPGTTGSISAIRLMSGSGGSSKFGGGANGANARADLGNGAAGINGTTGGGASGALRSTGTGTFSGGTGGDGLVVVDCFV